MSLLHTGCSIVGDDLPGFEPDRTDRRIYVNDQADNDSLNAAVIEGVVFYLQPGGEYNLEIKGLSEGDSRLYLYRLFDYWETAFPEPITGSRVYTGPDSSVRFTFFPVSSKAELTWAVVRDPGGQIIKGGIEDVRLRGTGSYSGTSFGINYFFWGAFSRYPADSIPQVAADLHSRIQEIFAGFGPFVVGSSGPHVIASSERITVQFPEGLNTPPGVTGGNPSYVNVILVESIQSDSVDDVILGIAPREAWELYAISQNLVFLALENASSDRPSTLAHELGHFFGLRHTVSTEWDLRSEGDWSNLDDGFSDTEVCELPSGIAGTSGAVAYLSYGNYCLRISSPGQGMPGACDTNVSSNLMFPLTDSRVSQDHLSAQQVEFLQTNISLLPH
ncbi:M43 family zinc metalloprotease [Fibrobacterota bacterium]